MDTVIGAITGYTFDHVKYWVNSLNRCGFEGHKILICYGIDPETIKELNRQNIMTVVFAHLLPTQNIVVERFWAYWYICSCLKARDIHSRYIIATDVRDVVFQHNPIPMMERHNAHLMLSSESIAYQNEPWGDNNLSLSFGAILHHAHRENQIVNCGVIAGTSDYMLDLFLNLYLVCEKRPQFIPGGGGPDQAALNILMNTQIYKDIAWRTTPVDAWAAQLGTTNDPRKAELAPYLIHRAPIYDDGYFRDPVNLEKYRIVHQWDRMNPEIVSKISEMYS